MDYEPSRNCRRWCEGTTGRKRAVVIARRTAHSCGCTCCAASGSSASKQTNTASGPRPISTSTGSSEDRVRACRQLLLAENHYSLKLGVNQSGTKIIPILKVMPGFVVVGTQYGGIGEWHFKSHLVDGWQKIAAEIDELKHKYVFEASDEKTLEMFMELICLRSTPTSSAEAGMCNGRKTPSPGGPPKSVADKFREALGLPESPDYAALKDEKEAGSAALAMEDFEERLAAFRHDQKVRKEAPAKQLEWEREVAAIEEKYGKMTKKSKWDVSDFASEHARNKQLLDKLPKPTAQAVHDVMSEKVTSIATRAASSIIDKAKKAAWNTLSDKAKDSYAMKAANYAAQEFFNN